MKWLIEKHAKGAFLFLAQFASDVMGLVISTPEIYLAHISLSQKAKTSRLARDSKATSKW
jgi:hypothetical protein